MANDASSDLVELPDATVGGGDRDQAVEHDGLKHRLDSRRRLPVAFERPSFREDTVLPLITDLVPDLTVESLCIGRLTARHEIARWQARRIGPALRHHEHEVIVDQRDLIMDVEVAAVALLLRDERIDHDVRQNSLNRLPGAAARARVWSVVAPLQPRSAERLGRWREVIA